MPIKTVKPVSPARRHYQVVDYSVLSKVKPLKSLTVRGRKRSGRNSFGRITVRHRGSGEKRQYRLIEFGQNFLNHKAKVEALEYDPNRTAFIARVLVDNGQRAYVLAAEGLKVGAVLEVAAKTSVKVGNRMQLKNIPVGTSVYNVELQPGQAGRLARSAGSAAIIMATEGKYAQLKMPSGEIRLVLADGFASLGQASNAELRTIKIGKAGRQRHKGIRPTVRGKAMNPRDHPYGGGEGRTTRGTRKPKDKWGNVTGGRRTRRKRNWSNKLIMQRRPSKKKK